MKTFVSVAGLLSFRRAAEVLHYAPSTVSAQIQALEAELRLRLFDRLEKGIRLTEAGERFLPYALKLLALARESASAAAGEHARQGMLAIRMPETLAAYRFPALLPLFRQEHPAMGLRLRGSSTHDVQRYLEKGLDLAFVVGEARPAENCFIEKIGGEELVLAGNAADWGTGPARIEAPDLAGRMLLCASSDSSGRAVLERFLGQNGVQGNVWIDFSSLAALKNSLRNTAGGCALLPRVALEQELDSGVLAELVLHGLPVDLPVNMLWHREKWMSPSLTFFMDLFRNAWREAAPARKRPPGAA
ncbi:LysR family transcriptional regulator [Fundidesulfovibrio terrae]|uniref:LysR family transcriptional regulator n=1 Tax=Fundidesulfovibrio terrae TaxID=2922866 RepID=UPI001FAFE00F